MATTRSLRGLGTRLPLVSAAMTGVAGGQMAAEMAQAGGYGFIAANGTSPSHFKTELDLARSILGQSDGRLSHIGAGLLGWRLEAAGKERESEDLVRLICPAVSYVWLSFGRHLDRWVKLVREVDKEVRICIVVSSVEAALEAVRLGADVLIVQGHEAGGHGASESQPLFTILPLVAQALRAQGLQRPLLAAGGLVHPSQVAAALVLEGCIGAVLGTALLATSASAFSASAKSSIVAATRTGPRSMLYDRLRGQLDWPEGVDGRALENAWTDEPFEGVDDAELKRRFDAAAKEGTRDRMITWAGTSVGFVDEETSLAKIVARIEKGIHEALKNASNKL